MSRLLQRLGAFAASLVLIGVLAGASAAVAQPASVDWHGCPASWKMPQGWECARYPVPLNYARPRAGTVSLAVARLPAEDQQARRGSIFFNPGGPGGSGLGLASSWEGYVGPEVRRVYDLVTWDPRGVIHSPALFCLSPEASRRARSKPDAVLNDPEINANLRSTRQIATGCAKQRLTKYVTTMDNVRDLDRLRQAVGDQRLSYVGISYGTVIGAVYANVFPGRYRAIVLHGVVDSVTWFQPSFAFTTDDGVELQKDLGQALKACDAAPRKCKFAPRAPEKYAQLLSKVRGQAISSGDSEEFTGLYDISRALVGARSAKEAIKLAAELQSTYRRMVVGHASSSPQLIAASNGPRPPDTWADRSKQNSADVLDTTVCSDAGKMPSDWISAARQADKLAPVFGVAAVLLRSVCASWSAFGARYTGGWAAGKKPILVLNQQWDDATPLAWAQTMTRKLGDARLITISGWGHGQETDCSRGATDSYLLSGDLPSVKDNFCGDGRRLFG